MHSFPSSYHLSLSLSFTFFSLFMIDAAWQHSFRAWKSKAPGTFTLGRQFLDGWNSILTGIFGSHGYVMTIPFDFILFSYRHPHTVAACFFLIDLCISVHNLWIVNHRESAVISQRNHWWHILLLHWRYRYECQTGAICHGLLSRSRVQLLWWMLLAKY